MIPADWNRLLHPDVAWQTAYATVEAQARAHLSANPIFDGRKGISTDELVEALYPEALARGDGILARKRIYKALKALTTRGLADCCERGEERLLKHSKTRKVRPWLWHEPGQVNAEAAGKKFCPHCGGVLEG